MNGILLAALLTVSVIALALAFGHGHDLFRSIKAKRERDAAIRERDMAAAEHDQCWRDAMDLIDKVANLESERLKALEKIGQQARTIEAYTALQETSHHRIDELTGKIDECNIVLDLKENQITELTKEIQQWKAANETNRSGIELFRIKAAHAIDMAKQAAALLAKVQ